MRYFLFLFIITLYACGPTEENVNIRLTMKERSALDTRIIAYMDSLRPAMQAECADTRMDRIAVATDSIVQRRLEEEARLRARIPQNLRR